MFPTAEMLLKLYELEHKFETLRAGVSMSAKWTRPGTSAQVSEIGRSRGFWAARNVITEEILKIDRDINRKFKL